MFDVQSAFYFCHWINWHQALQLNLNALLQCRYLLQMEEVGSWGISRISLMLLFVCGNLHRCSYHVINLLSLQIQFVSRFVIMKLITNDRIGMLSNDYTVYSFLHSCTLPWVSADQSLLFFCSRWMEQQ